MNRAEEQIQRSVFQHLRARGMPGVFAFHPANGGKRTKAEAGIFKAIGVVAGTPDVIAIYRGAVHALELKALRGRVTPLQKAAMDALEQAGARVAVAYTLDEALITLEFWGLLRRDKGRSVPHRVPSSAGAGERVG